jgi:hypothetical protein
VAKIGVKTSNKARVVAKEDWKSNIDLIEADQDEWDDWLETPAAQASGGQGRVRFVRADLRNPVLYRRGR